MPLPAYIRLPAVLLLAGAASAQEGLRDLAARRGIAVGTAVGGAFWGSDSRYRATLEREYGILVAENVMKWDPIQPRRGEFDWTRADELAAFAAKSGAALRGHALVWHQQSRWVENDASLDRGAMLALLRDHIGAVAGRYRGKVREWDVVNEAVDDGPGNLRDSFWRRRIGDDYLDSAFRIAHRADPGARLYYNDYGAEDMGPKAGKVYALVKGLKDRGVPIHGVGLQCHFANTSWPNPADIGRNLQRLADLGLEVSITELDFRIQLPADSAALARQRNNYAALLSVCLSQPACKSFLTWGFTDAHSWVPGFFTGMGAALPFDADYGKKPAYHGLRETLAQVSVLRPPHARNNGFRLFSPPGSGHRLLFYDPTRPGRLRTADGRFTPW